MGESKKVGQCKMGEKRYLSYAKNVDFLLLSEKSFC